MPGTHVVYAHSGQFGHAFQAHTQLWCDICGRAIAEGQYFTKQNAPTAGPARIACAHCQPFRFLKPPFADEPLAMPPEYASAAWQAQPLGG